MDRPTCQSSGRLARLRSPPTAHWQRWAARSRQVMTSDPEHVFAGLAGRPLDPASCELGDGVVISQTFAHVMAPLMAAFAPAPPGGHHPAPWKVVSGGF